jgi:hypothetical protein
MFRCFEPISKQSKQTELFRNKLKQTEPTLNFHKITKICSLSKCFSWSSFCFGSIETSKLSVSVWKRNNQNKPFRNKPKQIEKNRETPKFSEKIPKYAPYQTVLVGLLFVWVQSKHRISLFRYRSKITETNVLFRIVLKLVSIVSN